MRFVDEAPKAFGQPVIPPGLAAVAVHALLDHDPVSFVGDDEAVEIEVKAVLDRRAVDLGNEPARPGERRAVEAHPITDRDELIRRLTRVAAAPAADMDANLRRQRGQAALQRSDDARCDTGGMPIHSHHRTERLEPERMRQSAQHLVSAILQNDRRGDHRAEPGHAIA